MIVEMSNKVESHAIEVLKFEEGFSEEPYKCSMGYWTTGHGLRLPLKKREIAMVDLKDRVPPIITEGESERILKERLYEMWDKLCTRLWLDNDFDVVMECPDNVQVALGSMVYQMGPSGVLTFKRMIAAMQRGDWHEAAKEALDSDWARTQTPERANRMANLIRTGEVN